MTIRMLTLTSVLLMGAMLGAVLSGCGQKGELYLPDAPSAERTG